VRTYEVTAHSTASVSTLYALLVTGSTWPTWSPVNSLELDGADGSSDGTQQVGDVRVIPHREAGQPGASGGTRAGSPVRL
jgi:hypothetical protein